MKFFCLSIYIVFIIQYTNSFVLLPSSFHFMRHPKTSLITRHVVELYEKPVWPPITMEFTSQNLQNTRIILLEKTMKLLLEAIINSDDIALNEREVLKCGPIYLECLYQKRHPRLLRNEVKAILNYTEYNDIY
jgi:hypothetical protein